MDGEKHGTEIETKTARKGKQTSGAHDQTPTTKKVNGAAARPTGVEESVEVEPVTSSKVATPTRKNDDYKALLDKQEARIRELEGQVAEAAKTAAAAEKLSAEIEALRASSAEERVSYELKLAGARSVTAARALLDEHDGDVATLKECEPWLFETPSLAASGGTTGLEPAGTSRKDDKEDMRRWREIAGLTDDKE